MVSFIFIYINMEVNIIKFNYSALWFFSICPYLLKILFSYQFLCDSYSLRYRLTISFLACIF